MIKNDNNLNGANEMKSTIEIAAEKNDPKEIYDILEPIGSAKYSSVTDVYDVYCDVAEVILQVVKTADGWQADIAKKALSCMKMSDKQRWCIAYEYIKMAVSVDQVLKINAV